MPDMGNIRIKDENMNKTTIITNVQTRLFELQDLKYRDFHAKLMPTVNKEKIIGVRTPALRVFAKKYGKTDEAKEYLEKEGIEHATINLGGNVLTIGTKPDGSDYKIGIQKPFAADGEVLEVLSVHDRSVVSSGDYERYFEKDGVIYHHILDPQSGWPVQNDLDQVTILSDSSADGDALSTTCYVLGLEKGMKLIQEMDDVEAIFVTKDGEIHRSY